MSGLSDRVVEHLRAVARDAELPDLTQTKYAFVSRIDRGGMGTVYLALDRTLGREVALKVLGRPDPTGEMSASLLREAKLVARLEHPNIVPVHDVGTLPDGRLYYVMKYVRGKRLDAWRRAESSRAAGLRLFQSICEAVAFAHDRGVVHRDLKPENVMVGPFGEALVMDWGVAKARELPEGERATRAPLDDAETGLAADAVTTVSGNETARGTIVGTPSYMAPEQARGEVDRIDARTDVYALGAILYFLLGGRPPFEGASGGEILRRVVEERPAPLRQLDPSVPKALESICTKAMAREQEGRYGTALEMAADIDRYLDGFPVRAHAETLTERTARLVSRNRALLLLVLGYLIMRVVWFFFART